MCEMLVDENTDIELDIIFQKVENLHKACKNHKGDWYFTGNYPTLGGNKVCLLYTSPSPRDATLSRMPSSA